MALFFPPSWLLGVPPGTSERKYLEKTSPPPLKLCSTLSSFCLVPVSVALWVRQAQRINPKRQSLPSDGPSFSAPLTPQPLCSSASSLLCSGCKNYLPTPGFDPAAPLSPSQKPSMSSVWPLCPLSSPPCTQCLLGLQRSPQPFLLPHLSPSCLPKGTSLLSLCQAEDRKSVV